MSIGSSEGFELGGFGWLFCKSDCWLVPGFGSETVICFTPESEGGLATDLILSLNDFC